MKKILTLAAAGILALLTVTGCEKDPIKSTNELDVSFTNVAGTWQLMSINGTPLDESLYVYITFIRKDHLFEMYQNLDSFSARKITGEFNIQEDAEFGAIIRGKYDHGTGEWEHRYIVSSLTREQMIWTAKDNGEITVYKRVNAIPDDIANDYPAEK